MKRKNLEKMKRRGRRRGRRIGGKRKYNCKIAKGKKTQIVSITERKKKE